MPHPITSRSKNLQTTYLSCLPCPIFLFAASKQRSRFLVALVLMTCGALCSFFCSHLSMTHFIASCGEEPAQKQWKQSELQVLNETRFLLSATFSPQHLFRTRSRWWKCASCNADSLVNLLRDCISLLRRTSNAFVPNGILSALLVSCSH